METLSVVWQIEGVTHSKVITADRPVAIGRNPLCDIVLGDPYVSRQHAAIIYKNGVFHLHNLSKTNAILFNDRWTLSPNLKADLEPGDCFEIGRVRMSVGNPQPSRNGHI